MRLDAKILLAIEDQLDDLVQRAERCVEDTKAAQTDTQDTQFRNLQNMAAATDSVLALENFIGYQIGRKYINAEVGRRILQDIDELKRIAEEIYSHLGLANENLKRQTHMELIRLYLGFLVRKLVAERRG